MLLMKFMFETFSSLGLPSVDMRGKEKTRSRLNYRSPFFKYPATENLIVKCNGSYIYFVEYVYLI